VLREVGDRYLAALAELGVETIDMRAIISAQETPAFWRSDHHLNTLGHDLVASELAARLESADSESWTD
jgi:hypothetical protein